MGVKGQLRDEQQQRDGQQRDADDIAETVVGTRTRLS
jgi:hypothetical protein